MLKKPFRDWTEDEKEEFGNKEYLREEEKYLMREKVYLMREKVYLMREKVYLMREKVYLMRANEQLMREKEQLLERDIFTEKGKQLAEYIEGIGSQVFGRSYENTFRISFIKALFNEGKGLVVSAEYFTAEKACRKYTMKSHPELFEQCRAKLKTLNWEEQQLRFEDIEIDCVLRCYNDTNETKEFAEPAKILLPSRELPVTTPQSLTRKISDNSVDVDGELPTPNSYIVVEITSNSANLEQKLVQLEKDLLFLLLRNQKEFDTAINVESIISYAFLVIPYSPLKKSEMDNAIMQSIVDKEATFPLLFWLYKLGRFARFFTPAGFKAVITGMSALIADNASSSQLSLEAKKNRMKNERLDILTKELITAKAMDSPDIVSQIKQELTRMIMEDLSPESPQID